MNETHYALIEIDYEGTFDEYADDDAPTIDDVVAAYLVYDPLPSPVTFVAITHDDRANFVATIRVASPDPIDFDDDSDLYEWAGGRVEPA